MGCIVSFREAIDRTRFTALKKGTVHKAESVILLDRPGGQKTGPDMALVKLTNGQFTVLGASHSPNGDWAVMGYGLTFFQKSVLGALVKIGAISQDDMDLHLNRIEAHKARMERKRAAEDLERSCKALGIPVPDVPEAAE